MKVAVIGGGTWGTTVANLCAQNKPTMLWARNSDDVASINDRHENARYLPGYALHNDLTASTDLAAVLADADVTLIGLPSDVLGDALNAMGDLLVAGTPIISLTKGFDPKTAQRMSEVIARKLPGHRVGVLTGPNLAKEILDNQATASVLAFEDLELAESLQSLFATERFRIYTNPDVTGCEIGGALKNVIAIAVGMADGLSAGDNTRAALVTRGVAEMTRLGVALGGEPETFTGLAGMGDLLATSISDQSRNRAFGEALGKGQEISTITAEMDHVVEGVTSAPIVARLAREAGVELPICEQVRCVIEEGRTAQEAYRGLLRRPQQSEINRLA